MRRKRTALALIVAAIALSLSACGPLALDAARTSETDMNDRHYDEHVQAKAEIETLYQESIALVGDEHWTGSEYEWGGCGRSDKLGTDSWLRVNQWRGPLDRTPTDIANDVAELWNKRGFPVIVETDETLTPPRKIVSYPAWITGSTAEGFLAVFSVAEGFANFRGFSRCVDPYPSLDDRYPDSTTDR
jgi:hypothetical protein